jgi:hypothetical protein
MPTMSSIACSSLRPCVHTIARHVWKSRARPIALSTNRGDPSYDSQPVARLYFIRSQCTKIGSIILASTSCAFGSSLVSGISWSRRMLAHSPSLRRK